MAILLSLALLVPLGTWHDAQARLALSYPRGWHVTTRELTAVTDPAERSPRLLSVQWLLRMMKNRTVIAR
jgi:hypothetical protein